MRRPCRHPDGDRFITEAVPAIAEMNRALARLYPAKLAVEAGPALLIYLPGHPLAQLAFGDGTKPFGGQLAGAQAQAVADIVTIDDEIGAALVDTAHDDMTMRVVSVPMVDRDPVEPGAEIGFHPRHQCAGEALEVVEILGVLGRRDEPELVTIALGAFDEGVAVGPVAGPVIGLACLSVAGDTVALDVADVAAGRSGRYLAQIDQAGLDHHATTARVRPALEDAGSNTPPAAHATPGRPADRRAAAIAAGRLQHLRGEPPRRAKLTPTPVALPSWPGPERIVFAAAHTAHPRAAA